LRAAGISAVFDYGDRRLGNQLKGANQVGARWAVILGPQEIEAGEARIRDMSNGDEVVVSFDQIARAIRDGRGNE
jgi:histidyl-tRNA synthetase